MMESDVKERDYYDMITRFMMGSLTKEAKGMGEGFLLNRRETWFKGIGNMESWLERWDKYDIMGIDLKEKYLKVDIDTEHW